MLQNNITKLTHLLDTGIYRYSVH